MSFKQIIGQEKAVSFLKKSLSANRIAHAYLFLGPEGIGKSLAAKNFAKVLNCQKDGMEPCDECEACLKIEKGIHPDVHWIEKEHTEIKIEAIRNLQNRLSLRPYEGKKKVFIINDAQDLNDESTNALLKVLEEPPQDSVLILIACDKSRIYPTILSRCQKINFASLDINKLKELLSKDYKVDKDYAHFLSGICEGRLGFALRIKDKFSLRQKNKLLDEILNSDTWMRKDALDTIDRENLEDIFKILISWLRDIFLSKLGFLDKFLINIDQKEKIARIKNKYSFKELEEGLRMISEARMNLAQNINPKLVFDLMRQSLCKI